MPAPREASPVLKEAMEEAADLVNETIDMVLPTSDLPEAPLYEAMRYATLGGGKRLRPFLVITSAKLFGVDVGRARRVAAAVELIHSYSLIHDDLPAMDNAATRRGKPTVHRNFDEATAVLAGDALQALAFEILADPGTHEDPRVRCALVTALAQAGGGHGLCGGQMLDLIAETQDFDVGTISRLQRMKTGGLITFCCEAGALLGRADPAHLQALRAYANDLGLAFQVTDDLLDIEGNASVVGKAVNQDDAAGKATFVSTLGVEQARARAQMLVQQATRHLWVFQDRANMLKEVAEYVLERRA